TIRDTGPAVRSGVRLGQSVARHLIELHSGTFEELVDDESGTTFVVKLPLLAAEVPVRAVSPEERLAAPRLDGVSVLVVDDEADGRDLVRACLERAGAVVEAVDSAAQAMVAIERSVPDVLVSDIAMPGEDGYALMARVRALEGGRGGQVPAVALTAFARPVD